MWFSAFTFLLPVVGAHMAHSPTDWTFGVDGALHVSFGTVFHALNTDGSIKWTFNAISPISIHKEGLNGTIHIIAQPDSQHNWTHYALDGMDGSIQWQLASQIARPCEFDEGQLLISDRMVYFVCSGRIEAIDIVGAWKWSEWFRSTLYPMPVDVGPDGGLLVVSEPEDDQHVVSALQPENGKVKWTVKKDKEHRWTLSKGNVFVTRFQEKEQPATTSQMLEATLFQLSAEDGGILWNASYNTSTSSVALSIASSGCNGDVYVQAGQDGDSDCHIPHPIRLLGFDSNGKRFRDVQCLDTRLHHSIWQKEDGTEEDIFVVTSEGEGGKSQKTAVTTVAEFSGTTGHFLWNASIPCCFSADGFGADGTVLGTRTRLGGAGVSDMYTVAFNHGHEIWRTPASSAVLMAKDSTTYFQRYDYDHHISGLRPLPNSPLIVDAVDMGGQQKWTHNIDPALDAQPSFVLV